MSRARVASVCALLLAGNASADDMSGANHRFFRVHVSSGFVFDATSVDHQLRLSVGEPDPPGFAASLTGFHGAALGFIPTLVENLGAVDPDGDGVPTLADGCPFGFDPAQPDLDGDLLADACDPDDDNDTLTDLEEAAAATNPRLSDTDGDGLSDATELLVRGTNPLTLHSDGDFVPDATDLCPTVSGSNQDSDGDGLGDVCDPDAQGKPFWTFESGLVRPLAVTPDGSRLLAVNVPDNRLEIFQITPGGLSPLASVPVGLEPVAVAARSNGEAWVVNHLSDSVSIVSLADPPQVVRTLLVGDEPRDVVFAGPAGARAFVTTAHRGQNSPFPRADYNLPGVGRADVWVFDATALGAPLGGTPLTVLTLFGDKPRALAVSANGSRVFAAVMNSGNRTSVASEGVVCPGGEAAPSCVVGGVTYPGGLPAPSDDHAGVQGPETGLIVRFDPATSQWRDEAGRNWSNAVRFDLPDFDVFELDANATPPVQVRAFSGVGTTIFGLATNPVTGAVYAANTDAQNLTRFEGHGVHAAASKPPGTQASVRGHLHEARVTILQGTTVTPRHLNKHIPYGVSPVPAGVKEASLAIPTGLAVSPDGATLYVAAFGSSKIGVFGTAALANDTFVPSAASHFPVAGGGPAGLALAGGRLYTLTRFTNEVVALDALTGAELDRRGLHSPEPAIVTGGRRFLYDAVATSSNGETSCASCHVFGDVDDLAWDLGDPDGDVVPNPNFTGNTFHPNKGPMTTQTLRGLAHSGPMHWRGDRNGSGCNPPILNYDLCERQAFTAFNVAFDGLLGRDEGPLAAEDMDAFTSFILEVTLPPNPVRQLDNSLRAPTVTTEPSEARGLSLWTLGGVDGGASCDTCHQLAPGSDLFGTQGLSTFDAEPQIFKIAHIRTAYQKLGMFGVPQINALPAGGNYSHRGPQIRGFGYLHDGSVDTLERFVGANIFNLAPQQEKDLEAFMVAFDSNLAPIVGQQVTLSPVSNSDSLARAALLAARAQVTMPRLRTPQARECDLVVTGAWQGESRSWLLQQGGTFRSDGAEARVSLAALQQLAVGEATPLTFTCAPPGSGVRIAVDRDLDGVGNFVETLLGTDPLDGDSDGDGTADGAEESDGDRIPDARDNCLFVENVGQRDRGGVTSTAPDGVGDTCQCGDLTGDGRVLAEDADFLRNHLAYPAGYPFGTGAAERCRVDLASGNCDIVQLTILRQVLAGVATARIDPVCMAAIP